MNRRNKNYQGSKHSQHSERNTKNQQKIFRLLKNKNKVQTKTNKLRK